MILLFSQVTYQKKRSRTLEEQLKKCELKVSINDTQLAEQVLVYIIVVYFNYIFFLQFQWILLMCLFKLLDVLNNFPQVSHL